LSSENSGAEVKFAEITGGGVDDRDAGVTGGGPLLRFVAAVHLDDAGLLAQARDEVAASLGADVMTDAAGVIGNFTMMTRIADSTGTPLDKGSVPMTESIRSAMGINDYATARLPE
jgi:hypothetical protein